MNFDRRALRIGECDWFRLSIAGKSAGDQEFDPNSVRRIAKILAALEQGNVPQANQILVGRFASLRSH